MQKNYTTSTTDETRKVAAEIAKGLCGGDIYTFAGELGAGKTTFIQGVLSALGAEGPFTSPTFTIVRTYALADGSVGYEQGIHTVYHIDAYRIDAAALADIGWDEMISDKKALVLIEWPERISESIPEQAKNISLESLNKESRNITIA